MLLVLLDLRLIVQRHLRFCNFLICTSPELSFFAFLLLDVGNKGSELKFIQNRCDESAIYSCFFLDISHFASFRSTFLHHSVHNQFIVVEILNFVILFRILILNYKISLLILPHLPHKSLLQQVLRNWSELHRVYIQFLHKLRNSDCHIVVLYKIVNNLLIHDYKYNTDLLKKYSFTLTQDFPNSTFNC